MFRKSPSSSSPPCFEEIEARILLSDTTTPCNRNPPDGAGGLVLTPTLMTNDPFAGSGETILYAEWKIQTPTDPNYWDSGQCVGRATFARKGRCTREGARQGGAANILRVQRVPEGTKLYALRCTLCTSVRCFQMPAVIAEGWAASN